MRHSLGMSSVGANRPQSVRGGVVWDPEAGKPWRGRSDCDVLPRGECPAGARHAPKDITLAQDETFTGGLCLVGMKPVSNYIVL
jgi:hypothetical protein